MKIVFAKVTATVPLPLGGQITVREGSHWLATDPLVVNNESLFTDDPTGTLMYSDPSVRTAQEAPVEQATAAPGERREAVRPRPMGR